MRDSVHCQTGAVTHEVIECTTSVKSTMDSPFRRILAILGVMTILGALGVAAFHRTSTFNSNLKVVQPEEMSTYALPITFAQFSVLPPAFNDIEGYATLAEPLDACTPLTNEEIVQDTIVIATRGGCEFYKKAQHIEDAGGIAFVVSNEIDNFLPMPNWGTEGQTRVIQIPGGIIYGQDGVVLRRLIDGSVPVRLRLSGPHLCSSDLP